MVFSSITFLFYFLPASLLLYFWIPSLKGKNTLLLAVSLLFYAWGEPAFVLLMVISIAANWALARWIAAGQSLLARRMLLLVCLVFNLGTLFLFKYLALVLESFGLLFAGADKLLVIAEKIPLPVGISFYTFQALSYVIDVYRREVPPEKSVLDLGTYISMFPQLIAGPIVRYQEVRLELSDRTIDWQSVCDGAKVFVIGLSLKVLLANSFAGSADHIFGLDAGRLSPGLAWLGAGAYSFQIYFDFAGYSLMAIGLGRVLGFTFPINFNRPYIACSITDFWKRWHISLSTWFRDYLYIPLGGNRGGIFRTCRNLLIVFFLCGLWHGAAWTFVAWGLYHGAFLVFERIGGRFHLKIPRVVKLLYTLTIVLIGWVLFRCESFSQMLAYLSSMFGATNEPAVHFSGEVFHVLTIPLFLTGAVFAVLPFGRFPPRRLHVLVYVLLFSACVGALVAGTHNPFIYFRF